MWDLQFLLIVTVVTPLTLFVLPDTVTLRAPASTFESVCSGDPVSLREKNVEQDTTGPRNGLEGGRHGNVGWEHAGDRG